MKSLSVSLEELLQEPARSRTPEEERSWAEFRRLDEKYGQRTANLGPMSRDG